MGSLDTSIVAWLGLPALLLGGSLGIGLLCERVSGCRLPGRLIAPVGFCVAIALLLAPYRLGAAAEVGAAVFVVLALAGLLCSQRDLRRPPRPGWTAAGGLAVYALYMAPVLAAGGWTWTGYNFVNDTAVQFLLADHLAEHGASMPMAGYSTASIHVRGYLDTGYPLGVHSLLATLDLLVPAPLPALYQPLIATAAALAAMALATLAGGAGLGAAPAAAAGAMAMAANLTYNYGLQGNAKELAFMATLAVAAAMGVEVLRARQPARAVAVLALCLAGGLALFSAAALPYIGALALALLLAAVLSPASRLRRRLLPTAVVGFGVLVAASVPTLVTLLRFGEVAGGTFGAGAEAGVIRLGHLARPLPIGQIGGVWLTGDYRVPVEGIAGVVTAISIAAVAVAFAAGLVWLLRRRAPGPLLLVAATALTLAVLLPRVSPYAAAKLLALGSPAVLLVAGIGVVAAARRPGRLWPVAYLTGAALAVGVIASAGYSYRVQKLAPIDRLQALSEAADHVPARGRELYLIDDFEEFAKYFTEGRQNVALETLTPKGIRDFLVLPLISLQADIDQMPPGYVQSFDSILQRRGPAASRAPSSYELVYRNRWYAVWSRRGARVRRHIPLQALDSRTSPVSCDRVRRLAALAQPGDRVTAARGPEVVVFDTATVAKGVWRPAPPDAPGVVIPATPATVAKALEFDGGLYRVWLRAGSGRRFDVSVDGRHVASARGINTPGSWLPAGTARIGPGRRPVAVSRPGRSLRPGDAFIGGLGPVAFERVERIGLERVVPALAPARFCGESLDWLELTERAKG